MDIKKFINTIFVKKGLPPVKNFPAEFADGSKFHISYFYIKTSSNNNHYVVRFQQIFNILYDERIDCKLEKSTLLE